MSTKKQPTPEYITVQEAADLAGVSASTIYSWLDSGKVNEEVVAASRRYVNKASLLKHLGPGFVKVRNSS